MQIFLPGCQPSPYMPLGFVYIQYGPGLGRKSGVDLLKAFGDIFMYRTLTDPKLLCRLTDGGIVFNNIIGDADRSFFNIIFHGNPCISCISTIYAESANSILMVPLLPIVIFHKKIPSPFYITVIFFTNFLLIFYQSFVKIISTRVKCNN